MTVENGQEGDGGEVKLSRRCYQVKPPTAGCRHGDAMVTTRCSSMSSLREGASHFRT